MVKALQTSLNHGKIFNKEIITGKTLLTSLNHKKVPGKWLSTRTLLTSSNLEKFSKVKVLLTNSKGITVSDISSNNDYKSQEKCS